MTGSERKDHFQHQDDWVWGVCGQRERERERGSMFEKERDRKIRKDRLESLNLKQKDHFQQLGVGYQLETERVYELWSEREYTFEKERDSLKEMKSVINSF